MYRLVDDQALFDSYVIIQTYGFMIAVMLFYKCWKSMQYGRIMETLFGATNRLILLASHLLLLNISIYHYFEETNEVIKPNWYEYLYRLLNTEISLAFAILIYILKFPESIWPGKFDIYFNSHQIMHVSTLFTGIYVRYYS